MDRDECSQVGHRHDVPLQKTCHPSLFTGRKTCLLVVSRADGQKWWRTDAARHASDEAV
jgi:hypothetical protein